MTTMSRRTFVTTTVAGAVALGAPGLVARAGAQEPIRIGVLTPLTGGGAVYGTMMQRTYQALAEEINKAGGIAGRTLQLFNEDAQTNPDAAVRAARKLIDVNRIQVLMGTWSSAVTLAVAPIAVQNSIPMFCVSSSPVISTFADNDLLYRTYTSQAFVSGVFTTAARRLGFKTAGLMILNNPYGIGLGDSFAERFTKAGGTITGKVVYNPNQASYRSEIQQALGAKPDVIVFGGYTPDGVQIFKEWFQLGLGGTWMGPGFAFNQQFTSAIGNQAAEGIIVIEAAPNFEGAAFKNADKLFKGATGQSADFFVAMAYDHLMVAALSILAAKGDTSGNAVKAQIRRVSNPPGKAVGTWAEAAPLVQAGQDVNYEGASSAVDFDGNGDVVTDFGIYRIRGGKWALEQTIKASDVKAAG